MECITITYPEVAAMLGVSIDTIKLLSMRGELPSAKVGHRRVFVKDQIEEWLRNGGTAKKSELKIAK